MVTHTYLVQYYVYSTKKGSYVKVCSYERSNSIKICGAKQLRVTYLIIIKGLKGLKVSKEFNECATIEYKNL